MRGRQFKTTVPDTALQRPQDRVKRNFSAERPDALWVSDLTYVATWNGFAYVAFVIDAFARCIVGWRVSNTTIAQHTSWPSRHDSTRTVSGFLSGSILKLRDFNCKARTYPN